VNALNFSFFLKVLSSVGSSLERALNGLDILALSITAIARGTNQKFPFVAIKEYGLHVSKSMPMTKAFGTYLAPVVTFEQRSAWEIYSSRNPSQNSSLYNTENSFLEEYVTETVRLQESWSNHYHGPKQDKVNWPSSDVIYSDFGDIPYNTPRDGIPDILLPEWLKFPLVMTSYSPANWGKKERRMNG
jgi:hypothetical protein